MLLLTLLSVVAVWAFLTVLVIGLQLIFKALEGIRGNLQRITMGVRAIERQTEPLATRIATLGGVLAEISNALAALAEPLAAVERDVDGAARALRRR